MKVLMISTILPGQLRSGGALVTHSVLEGLRAIGCSATAVGYATDNEPTSANEVAVETRVVETQRAPFSALCWGTSALVRGQPYIARTFAGAAYVHCLTTVLNQMDWDLVIVDHAQMFWVLPYLREYPKIHLAHNAESKLYAALARKRIGLARWIYEREAHLINAAERKLARVCDEIWTLSSADADYFRHLGARSVLPLSIPVPCRPVLAETQKRIDVAILGSWTWEANRAGLDWYVREVHPLLPSDIIVEIAGNGAEDFAQRNANLVCRGAVADAASFLCEARCIAVPSISGTGIQIKTLDAIATGNQVVATPVAVRGIDSPPVTVTVAATAEAFAQQVVRICRGPETRSAAGIHWTEARQHTFKTQLGRSLRETFSREPVRDAVVE